MLSGRLYERYGTIVFGMTYRLLGDRQAAEECTQDVFVSVWRTAHAYEPERAQVSTWLLAIARNRAIDATRRRAARPVDPHEDVWSTEESPERVRADLCRATRQNASLPRWQSSPTPTRSSLPRVLRRLSHSEIAERLRLPDGTVKGRIRLALDRLARFAPNYALGAEADS